MTELFKKSHRKSRPGQRLTPLKEVKEAHLLAPVSLAPFSNSDLPARSAGPLDLMDLPMGSFRTALRAHLKSCDDTNTLVWLEIILHANSLRGRSKPSPEWIGAGETKIALLEKNVFYTACANWMVDFTPDPHSPDDSLSVLKGLIWLCGEAKDDRLTHTLSQYAMLCFRKVPSIGPRSKEMGNACLVNLEAMARHGHDPAVTELTVIRAKSVYPSVRKAADSALSRIADRRSCSQQELEDICLPDFSFDDTGKLQRTIGDYNATLKIESAKILVQWTHKDGKARKAMPAGLRKSHADATADLTCLQKSVSTMLSSQQTMIESSYLQRKYWPFAQWQSLLWKHPIRRSLIENLIWCTRRGDSLVLFAPRGDKLLKSDGKTITLKKNEAIRLWHPLLSDESERSRWREFTQNIGFLEPSLQFTRRTFQLHALERKTKHYTNRFAAHIIHHRQFAAICKKMDWHYKPEGLRNREPSCAEKSFAPWELKAEFSVVPIVRKAETRVGEDPSLATTDRLTFFSTSGEIIALEDIDEICLSEIMREVDVLIGITSRSDDLAWIDKGDCSRHRPVAVIYYFLEHSSFLAPMEYIL